MKKFLKILGIILGVIILGLTLAFYISKKTNKPCIHVEVDCEKYCETADDYQCELCHSYDYCGPEALLDKINILHI